MTPTVLMLIFSSGAQHQLDKTEQTYETFKIIRPMSSPNWISAAP